MREIIPLNQGWAFSKEWQDYHSSEWQDTFALVHLPHTSQEIALHYPNEKDTWRIATYQYLLDKNGSWSNKRVLIHFEGVSSASNLYVNGKELYCHKCGYTPFIVDITNELTKDKGNLISLKVDSTERADVPPFGGYIDYLCYGGIYREVELIIVDDISICENGVAIAPMNVLDKPKIVGAIAIYNALKQKISSQLSLELDNGDSIRLDFTLKGELYEKIEIDWILSKPVDLWNLDNPKLYALKVSLGYDSLIKNMGFKMSLFTEKGFYLNGQLLKLRGLNRHQSYPYVGYAMPKRIQERDAEILKHELGLNLVRTSHYPQSRHFLNRCDEIGLLVLEEIPGWQHIGDDAWKKQSVQNVSDMITRDMHHASIVLWGVRINESRDDHNFYVETNLVAHTIDKTRQTGGIRNIDDSELLEDVYTANDFVLNHEREALRHQKEVTGLSKLVPYLVTEYNGHMYPTKMHDQEERQMEHTNRHYRVLAAAAGDKNICGSIGWCAFDYHTHADFGSGDKICYHGVYDIYRNAKLAASAYTAQSCDKPYLKAVTFWARGERSVGGMIPLMVSTNCDYIRVYFGDNYLGKFYPANGRYPALEHAPIFVEDKRLPSIKNPAFYDVWGMVRKTGRIEGYINDIKVIEEFLSSNPSPKLVIKADNSELLAPMKGESWDSTRISVQVCDEMGHQLPYDFTSIAIHVEGAELIGDSMVSLEGGSYAFWIKVYQKGNVNIKVETSHLGSQSINLNVK